MSIKYSDCSNGCQYGADGKQLANWNPNLDYGNEYVEVYFRVETKGYVYPMFRFSEQEQKSFNEELAVVFSSLGWKCEKESYNGRCATWTYGKSHLYLHPQNFSGEVLKNEIKNVAEAIENCSTFKLRWVDLYHTVYDMSDAEYEEILTSKNEEIQKAILESCKTKRTSSFFYVENIARKLSERFRLRRIGENDGKNCGIGQTGNHIIQVADSLIKTGYLVAVEKNGTKLVRTINKTEQKQRKLFVA